MAITVSTETRDAIAGLRAQADTELATATTALTAAQALVAEKQGLLSELDAVLADLEVPAPAPEAVDGADGSEPAPLDTTAPAAPAFGIPGLS